MRKNYWLLFILLFTVSFAVVSCSDDDDDAPIVNPTDPDDDDPEWIDFVKTYSGSSLEIDGESSQSYQSVTIAESSMIDRADITLKNIIPETASLKITGIEITEAGDNDNFEYEFSATGKVLQTTVEIHGVLSTEGNTKVLDITVAREIDSDIVNTWVLGGNDLISIYYVEAENGDQSAMINAMLAKPLNELIASRVDDVIIDFTEDGFIKVAWVDTDGNRVSLDDILGDLTGGLFAFDIEYFVDEDNGEVTIAISKDISTLLSLASAILPGIGDVLDLLEDLGGYYGLTLGYVAEDGITFTINKELVVEVVPAILGFVGEVEDPQFQLMIMFLESIVEQIQTGAVTDFDVNLHFTAES
ncbi:MAG: hypothetical protein LIO79_00600 [Rikenellaceae bacterium]|nr:hypothetical protein [Rikenellaceae bacterium]